MSAASPVAWDWGKKGEKGEGRKGKQKRVLQNKEKLTSKHPIVKLQNIQYEESLKSDRKEKIFFY